MPENQPLTSSERGGGTPSRRRLYILVIKIPFFLDSNGYFDCFETKTSNSLLRKETVVFFFKFFFFPRLFTDSKYIRWCSATSGDKKKLLLSMSLSLVKFLP